MSENIVHKNIPKRIKPLFPHKGNNDKEYYKNKYRDLLDRINALA